MEIETQVGLLKKEIQELKNKKKDFWDVLQILGGLLIPAAIAFAGWQYSQSMKDAEIKSASNIANLQIEFSRQKAEFEQRISETNARVSQAGLVASFLESLLSKDETKQKIAIEAVLIALPAEGPRLVKVLEESGQKEGVKQFATKSLSSYKEKLIIQFFSDQKAVRSDAYARLQSSYQGDSSIIPMLISGGRQNPDNLNAVYNLLVFLSHMQEDALKQHAKEIEEYSREVEGNGEKTKDRAKKLRNRLPSS